MNAIKKLDLAKLTLAKAEALESSLEGLLGGLEYRAEEARKGFSVAQRSPDFLGLAKAQLEVNWREEAVVLAVIRRDKAIRARIRAEVSVKYWEEVVAQLGRVEAKEAARLAAKALKAQRIQEAAKDMAARRKARYSRRIKTFPQRKEVVSVFLPLLGGKEVKDGRAEVRELRASVVEAAAANTKEGHAFRQVNSCISRLSEMVEVLDVVKPLFKSSDKMEAGAACAVMAALAASYANMTKWDAAYPSVSGGTGEAAGHPLLAEATVAIETLRKLKETVFNRGWSTQVGDFSANVWFGVVKLSLGTVHASMRASQFCDLMKIQERCVIVDAGKEKLRHFHALERVIMAHRGGIGLKGMLENSKVWSVIDCPIGGNTRGGNFTAARVVKAPMESIWLQGVLNAQGLHAHVDSDAYQAHGYVSKYSEVFRESAFVTSVANVDGETFVHTKEGLSKIAIRTAKQDKPEGFGFRTKCDFVVVSAPKELYEKSLDGTATQEESETVAALIDSFLGGGGAAEGVYRSKFGMHRQVGAEVGGLGQKVVVGAGYVVLDPMFHHLLLANSERPTTVIGLSSVKSAEAKANLNWEPMVLENGVSILYAHVLDVDVCITESSATNAWEKVPAELAGDEGQLAATVKRVNGVKAPTLMIQVYTKMEETGLSLAEVLLEMQASGEIRRKNLSAKFNAQMLQSTRTYSGADQVEALLQAAMMGPKGLKSVRDLNVVMDLVHDRIDPSIIHEVQLDRLVARMLNAVEESNGSLDKEWSINQHGSVVLAVVGELAKTGKEWVRIVGTHGGKGVLFPAGQSLVTSYEGSQHASIFTVKGLLAELMEVLWHYITRSADLLAEDAVDKVISSAEEGVTMKALCEVRDQVAGKALARVQTFGSSLLLCTSAHLASNEVYSNVIRSQMSKAEVAYNEEMGVLLAKSPTIMAHQVRRVVVRELDVEMNWTEERAKIEALLDGTGGYVAADATVLNGDDADGDRFAAYVLPASCFLPGALGKTCYMDPSDPQVNCMASHAVEHFLNEERSLFVGAPRTLVENVFSCADIQAQVLEAAIQKSKVAEYSASLMSVQMQEVLVEADIVAFLQDGKNYPASWDGETFDIVQTLNLPNLAKSFRLIGECVLGTSIQLNAMNNIKGEDGKELLEMAKMLSPRRLRSLAKVYTVNDDVCQDITLLKEFQQRDIEKLFVRSGKTATPEQVAKYLNGQTKKSLVRGMTQVASLFDLYNVDLAYRGVNLDLLQLSDEVQVRLLIAGALVWAYARVGSRNEGAMCLESVIMKDVGVFANRRSVADLENLVRVTEASGVKVVSYDCVEAQLVAMAEHYRAL